MGRSADVRRVCDGADIERLGNRKRETEAVWKEKERNRKKKEKEERRKGRKTGWAKRMMCRDFQRRLCFRRR